jgi:hypothetical protein
MNNPLNPKSLPAILLLLIAVIVGYYLLNAPDRRNPAEKIGDAIQELGNRTPGEKIKDAIDDGRK